MEALFQRYTPVVSRLSLLSDHDLALDFIPNRLL